MSKIGKTTATYKIAELNKRIRIVQGGTAASKTFSILLYLIDKAHHDTKPTLTSIVSESFPHLKRGAMRDFLQILKELNRFNEKRWNKTDFVYEFGTGSKIEFFSVDQSDKVRGPRRDRLFINEANNVPFETYEQLEIRTNEFIFLDFNPIGEFWAFTELIGKRQDIDHLILTYKDNEALSEEIIKTIEQRKNRIGWWKVYGEGQLGEIEGRIYTHWQIIDEIPYEARLERYGLDFGYHPDPAAIVAIYYFNGGYILDEIVYQLELNNRDIAGIFKNLPQALVIADSAEPKSIDEIKGYGITILPANKGADSRRHGIKALQNEKISITKQSINLIKEYRNYLWKVDKNGKVISGQPEEGQDHLMDASRYGMNSLTQVIQKRQEFVNIGKIYHQKPKINIAL